MDAQSVATKIVWSQCVKLKRCMLGLIELSYTYKQEDLTQNSLATEGVVMVSCHSSKVLSDATYAEETAKMCLFWNTSLSHTSLQCPSYEFQQAVEC